MTRAVTLLAAGISATADAMMDPQAAMRPPSLPGLGAPLARRPLRPENFGAMPYPLRH